MINRCERAARSSLSNADVIQASCLNRPLGILPGLASTRRSIDRRYSPTAGLAVKYTIHPWRVAAAAGEDARQTIRQDARITHSSAGAFSALRNRLVSPDDD